MDLHILFPFLQFQLLYLSLIPTNAYYTLGLEYSYPYKFKLRSFWNLTEIQVSDRGFERGKYMVQTARVGHYWENKMCISWDGWTWDGWTQKQEFDQQWSNKNSSSALLTDDIWGWKFFTLVLKRECALVSFNKLFLWHP